MNCKLRCYNAISAAANGKPLTAVDRLILMRSNPLVHTEFQFSDRYRDISFSATMADGSNCCRWKQIDYSHPERWTTIELPMTGEQEDIAWRRAIQLEGKTYDLIGLVSFASDLNIVKPHKDKLWCSEACCELIVAAYGLDWIPEHYTPTGLFFKVYDWLYQKGQV